MVHEIKIVDVNVERFNPFNATAEELIANALDSAGLIKQSTTINDKPAKDYCRSFYDKGRNYRDLTKLGSILLRSNVINHSQLQQALDYQKQNPNMKIGDILLDLNLCTEKDISQYLNTQCRIREDIDELTNAKSKIISITERLKKML